MILNVPKGREPGGEGASGFITIPRHVSTFDTHLRLVQYLITRKFGDMHVH